MVTDSITNASIPMPVAGAKDFSKKKRVNRSAKLKQCKLDARREQWLSQVKSKRCKEEPDTSRGGRRENSPPERNESERSIENLEIKAIGKINEDSVHHFSDSDSPSNSPTSHTSSVLSSKASGTTFTGSSSSGSSSSSSGGSCSGSVAGEEDEEEEDDGCLDDWEAVADALAADDKEQQQQNPNAQLPLEHGNVTSFGPKDLTEPKIERVEKVPRAPKTCRAWKPDDAFRPQSLPNLSKQLSFPMKSSRHGFGGGGAWNCQNVVSGPCSCPICCEDLDTTERNFSPCSCGFKLCLFCHKRILEEDGRCPGCRKHYDHEPVKGEATFEGGNLTFRLARSCSMITRT